VERVKGIEPSAHSKPYRRSSETQQIPLSLP